MKRVLIVLLALAAAYGAHVVLGLPSRREIRALATANPGVTGIMRQRAEEARRAGRTPRRLQAWVPLGRVSRHLIHAVLASEDQRFFGHEGVDWEAVRKSIEEDRRKLRFARGGSTITQQLAKNLFFTTRKSLTRKLRELTVAWWMEQDLSKPRILELYLNVIEWGDGIYGCEAAARRYFGKAAADLDEAEAAGMAAMIPNPRRINPRVDAPRFARARRRVLWLMARAGYRTRDGGRLGAEPPVEVPPEDEELPPVEPEPEPSREPEPTPDPEPEPTPDPAPEPSPAPAPPMGRGVP